MLWTLFVWPGEELYCAHFLYALIYYLNDERNVFADLWNDIFQYENYVISYSTLDFSNSLFMIKQKHFTDIFRFIRCLDFQNMFILGLNIVDNSRYDPQNCWNFLVELYNEKVFWEGSFLILFWYVSTMLKLKTKPYARFKFIYNLKEKRKLGVK